MSVRNFFGEEALDRLKENPYLLCETVEGIGFEKADALAERIGFDRTGLPRVESGILYLLSYHAGNNGHTCLPEEKLTEVAAAMLGVEEEIVKAAIANNIKKNPFHSHPNPPGIELNVIGST